MPISTLKHLKFNIKIIKKIKFINISNTIIKITVKKLLKDCMSDNK